MVGTSLIQSRDLSVSGRQLTTGPFEVQPSKTVQHTDITCRDCMYTRCNLLLVHMLLTVNQAVVDTLAAACL